MRVIVRDVPDAALGQLATALNDLYRLSASARFHDETVRATGVSVTRSGLHFLSLVADVGPVSGTRLASVLDVSQPTASRVLAQLESDGYVARKTSSTDGRVADYAVTARGRRALGKVHAFHVSQLAEALGDIDPDRRDALADAVSELVSLLRRDEVPAARTA